MQKVDVNAFTVNECPQNKAEWNDREKKFKCPEKKEDVYHCVLDSEETRLWEACAPVVNIQGN